MAQTTPDASFGPFLVVTNPPIAYFVDYNCIYIKQQLVPKKHERNIKKAHLWPKRCVWCRLGPFPLFLPTLSHILLVKPIYIINLQLVSRITEGKLKKTHLGPKRRKMRRLGLFSSSWPNPSHIYLIESIYTINVQLVAKKNEGEYIKKLTQGPNDARCIVWARFCCPCPIHRLFSYQYLSIQQMYSQYQKKTKEK